MVAAGGVTHGISAVVALTASTVAGPLLAAWSAALADPAVTRWWRYRPVSRRRRLLVTVAAIVLSVPASVGSPALAWWMFAVGGAVLSVVDVQTHRLPARLTYPLALAIAATLTVSALVDRDVAVLTPAALAAAAVAGGYSVIRFLAPASLGQGDVRVAALAAALVGPMGWTAVAQAQVLTVLFTAGTAIVLHWVPVAGIARLTGQVPMGPAIIAAAVATLWL